MKSRHGWGGGTLRERSAIPMRVLAVSAAVVLSMAIGMGAPTWASASRPGGQSAGTPSEPIAFPPKANSAWAYDSATPGTWVDAIAAYNAKATPGHELNQVFTSATDMEMYCPDNDGARCTAGDLYSFYTPGSSGWARTAAYYDAFAAANPGSFTISPIIDGRTDADGYLQGFNELNHPGFGGGCDSTEGWSHAIEEVPA